MTAKTTAPANSTEIRTAADDDFAPNALIGYIAPVAHPQGHWVAMYLDYEDGSVRRWSRSVANPEVAEAFVRTDYHRALPRLRAEAAEWAAGYRAAVARAAAESVATESAWSAKWIAGFRAAVAEADAS
jgi:hypothetical protein